MEFENRKRLYLATKRSKDELHYAAYYGDLNTLQLLLRYYGQPMCDHRDTKGNTPIFTAIIGIGCTSTKIKMVEALIRSGAGINAVNDDGCTVLHVVVNTVTFRRISNKLIRLLIDYGADRTIANKAGKTAAELAFELHNGKLGQLLLFYDTSTPTTTTTMTTPAKTYVRREKRKKPKRSLGKLMKRLSLSLNNLAHSFEDRHDESNDTENDADNFHEAERRSTALTTPDLSQRRRSFGGYSYEEVDKDLKHVCESGSRDAQGSRGSRYRRCSMGEMVRQGPESGIFSLCRFSADLELGKSASDGFMGSPADSDLFLNLSDVQPQFLDNSQTVSKSDKALGINQSPSRGNICRKGIRRNSDGQVESRTLSKGLCTSTECARLEEKNSQRKSSYPKRDLQVFDGIEMSDVEESGSVGSCMNSARKGSLHANDLRIENKYIDLSQDYENDECCMRENEKDKGAKENEREQTGEQQKEGNDTDLQETVRYTTGQEDEEEPTYVDYTLERGNEEGEEKFAKTMTTADEDDGTQENRRSTEMLQHCSTMLSAVENLYLMTILKDRYKRFSEGSVGDSEC